LHSLGCEARANTPEQDAARAALRAKCDILWLNSTLFILLMLIQAGRPQAPSSPQKNLEGITMPPELNSRAWLPDAAGRKQQQRVLLMPERPSPEWPSLEIVERCDGMHTVQQIIWICRKFIPKPSRIRSNRTSLLSCPSAKGSRSRFRAVSSPFRVRLYLECGAQLPLFVSYTVNLMLNEISNRSR